MKIGWGEGDSQREEGESQWEEGEKHWGEERQQQILHEKCHHETQYL